MSTKGKPNKKGRSKGTLHSFVAVERYMMQTVAFRSLSPNARSAYLEVYFGYDGDNNGRILLSSQMLADRLNRDKSTAARALKELQDLGFIECMSKGGFNCKIPHASEWRLTAFKCDLTGELPTKGFMKWTPENSERGGTGEAHGGTGATDRLKATRNSPSQLHGCNREARSASVSGGTGATLLNYNHAGAAAQTVEAQRGAANQRASAIASNAPTDNPTSFTHITEQPLKSLVELENATQPAFRSWEPVSSQNLGDALARLGNAITTKNLSQAA